MTQRTNESRLAPRAVRMPSKTKKVIHDDPVVLAARQKLARRIESITGTAGEHVTAVPGVVLYHRDEQTPCYRASYKTSLSIFVQGRKHVILGQTEYVCDCSSFLLSSIDVPAQSQIVEASEKTPLLVMFLRFDMPMVRDVLTQEDLPEAEAHSDRQGLAVGETTPGLLEACQRLLNLVDTPEDIPFLSPLIQREIIYRLLKTPQASRLRSIATSGDLVQRTARAISWLRANFTKPLSIEELANTARMGVSNAPSSVSCVDLHESVAVPEDAPPPDRAGTNVDGWSRRNHCCLRGWLREHQPIQPGVQPLLWPSTHPRHPCAQIQRSDHRSTSRLSELRVQAGT